MKAERDVVKKCKRCSQQKKIAYKGFCNYCYAAYGRKTGACAKCGKVKGIFAKGICKNCYNKTHSYDSTKDSNYRRWHKGLEPADYRIITKKCALCGFDIFVELHHIDENHSSNQLNNLIGLCPNHHKMVHMDDHKTSVKAKIAEAMKNRT